MRKKIDAQFYYKNASKTKYIDTNKLKNMDML